MLLKRYLAAALFFVVAPLARADVTVVELFVSQNCKGCPEAEKLLTDLADKNDDVLLLSWGVSYWDYLGDDDPTALPIASDRQRNYAENLGLRGPYTPQAIYDGVSHCPGNRRRAVIRELGERRSAPKRDISLVTTGSGIYLTGEISTPAKVSLVEYQDRELDGYVVTNSVVSYTELADWSGGGLSVDVACETTCAVLVQEVGEGAILAAKRLN